MPASRPPARAPKTPPKPAAGKKAAAGRGGKATGSSVLPRPVLEQRQLDQIGLGLLALAVFLGFVLYLGAWGGAVGGGLADGLRTLFGRIAYVTPPATAALGILLVVRPLVPPVVRPFRLGAILTLLALLLLFAAGTFGLGGGGGRTTLWTDAVVRPRGGLAGDALYWAVSSLLGAIGAHVAAITAFLAGVLLLTGASVSTLVARTGDGLRQTTTVLKRVPVVAPHPATTVEPLADPEPPRRRVRAVVPPERDTTSNRPVRPKAEASEPVTPPEGAPVPRRRRGATGEAPAAGVGTDLGTDAGAGADIRATRRRGERPSPELDGARRYPDLFGSDDEVRLDLPTAPEPEPAAEVEPDEEPPTTVSRMRPAAGGAPRSERPTVAAADVDDEDEPTVEPGPDARPSLAELRARQPMGGDHDAPEEGYVLPDPEILKVSNADQLRPDTAGQAETAHALIDALANFKVDAKVIGTIAGPHITRYELRLAPGIKMSKVAQLKDDLAYALAATDIRILAPVPGKTAVGIEVPNKRRRIVHLGDVYGDPPEDASPLTVWLGKDVSGAPIHADLAKMPHILVAGTTGAGKSGCVNAMLSSLLLHATPDDVRLVLVDPKQVELNHYEAVPHLLTPVITSPKMAANALQNLVREMEWRYGVMSVKKTRNLVELNRVRIEDGDEPLPYILCVIDELADLMMVAPADVEDAIIRIAQKARAVGIHMVLATQSPRVDVITGMIKANVPSRIAFSVSSQTDSRVILDQNGAESLLGRGDMLFSAVGSSRLTRIQGAYIDEAEIAELTAHWARQGEPELREDLLEAAEDAVEESTTDEPDEGDPLLADAIEIVVEMGAASTSGLQRRLRVGYTRAGRLVDMMERRGIVSGYEGSKARQVLVGPMDLPGILSGLRGAAAAEDEAPAGTVEPTARALEDEPTDETGDHPVAVGAPDR